jgi:uncharacterized protein YkwD
VSGETAAIALALGALVLALAIRPVRAFVWGLLKALALLAGAAYVLLVFVHFSNGFDVSRSLELPAQDARMGLTCYEEPETVWQFVNRKPGHDVGIQRDQQAGTDVYVAICREGKSLSLASTDGPDAPLEQPSTAGDAQQTPTPTRAPTSLEGDELHELRLLMLDLINQDRAENGLPPVALGMNTAAQEHADDMLANGYISHWGTDGLRPYMRYTLAGGADYEAENVSYACYESGGRGWRLSETLADAEEGLMDSPGHRRNILNEWHTHVNIGIAYDRQAIAIVQQFEGDYATFSVSPVLAYGTILHLAGELAEGATPTTLQVWYNDPPEPLRRSQLLATRSYSLAGRPAAFIRPPAPAGSYYPRSEAAYEYEVPIDPQKVAADGPEPGQCAIASFTSTGGAAPAETVVPWVDAQRWDVSDGAFDISVDLEEVLEENGPGVYTVVLWGRMAGGESVAVTNYSLFVE